MNTFCVVFVLSLSHALSALVILGEDVFPSYGKNPKITLLEEPAYIN